MLINEQRPGKVVGTERTEPAAVQEGPTSAAARMLELAAVTADRLVADAQAEADSLVSAAQARAHEINASSRDEADRVAAELARSRAEQVADLDRARDSALTGLAEERAALEAQVDTLRQMERDHRSQLRLHLTEQLSMLDATVAPPLAAVAD